MKEIDILISYSLKMISEGDFNKAKKALLKVIELDPTSERAYSILGDVFYLTKNSDKALKSYLSSAHLLLYRFKAMFIDSFKDVINSKFNELTDYEKSRMPNRTSILLYENPALSAQLGHALIDYNTDLGDVIITECIDIYKDSLIKNVLPSQVIDKYNLCLTDYNSFDVSHFATIGREYILDNLKWDLLQETNVKKLYFQS